MRLQEDKQFITGCTTGYKAIIKTIRNFVGADVNNLSNDYSNILRHSYENQSWVMWSDQNLMRFFNKRCLYSWL